MKKILEILKRFKILVVVVLCIVAVFVYSHYTSYTFTAKVDEVILSNKLISLELSDAKQMLIDLGYTVEESKNEYNDRLLNAKKNDAYIKISESTATKIYEFSNTEKSITPVFDGVNWGDDIDSVKSKLGLNIMNTRFTSLNGTLGTNVYLSDSSIDTSIPPNRKSCISFWCDNTNKLNRLYIQVKK